MPAVRPFPASLVPWAAAAAAGALALTAAWAIWGPGADPPVRPAHAGLAGQDASDQMSAPRHTPAGLHLLAEGSENGRRVVYVQALPGGDVLVVDAQTGRLIEARPAGRPPGQPAVGGRFVPVQ